MDASGLLRERGLEAAAVSAGGFYETSGADPGRAFAVALELEAPYLVACVAPSRLADVAARVPAGVTLCVENHWDQALATPREVVAAIDAFPGVAACLDTGHALLAGVRPERFARDLGPRLRHVHLKDARAAGAERLLGRKLRRRLLDRPPPVFPGEGDLSLRGFAGALDRFDGTVTLEHEGADAARSLASLRRSWELAGPVPAPIR
jgi:inosose dehydratase